MSRIRKILIANRGEIAIRIMRTCRSMGIASVAVFSDADQGAPHVAFADEAVRIGPPPAAESYLRIDRIMAAARRTGADAIHPGYGFLAENAALASACVEHGITFIGPGADVIRLLGSKREAKRVAMKAGVPVIPGYEGDAQDTATLAQAALHIGFPVLIKASAGGGGKGMRIVRHRDELESAIESARRESMSAFGDDTLLIERYIERPRHVEIQILGDHHGNLVHLFERECSIQRRHQKIIEETPSVALDAALRQDMGSAAVAVGKAVGYVNAGTVEFIVAPDRRFYFLEVNTRLQVEHPVTEAVTGLDLVREQILVAQGQALGLGEVRMSGAAIECRLYAEDPDNGFLPTSGELVDWHVPEAVQRMPGFRVDAGVRPGQDIGIHYDPMLAKIICHAPTRGEAIQKMIYGLGALSVHGLVTNRDYLIRVLSHPAFGQGELDTHFIDTHAAELAAPWPDVRVVTGAAMAATLAAYERRRGGRTILPDLEPGFRNSRFCDERVDYELGQTRVKVEYRPLGQGRFHMTVWPGEAEPVQGAISEPEQGVISLIAWSEPDIVLEDEHGWRRWFRVLASGERHFIHGQGGALTLMEQPRFPLARPAVEQGACVAPMPGKIVKILVAEGQAVKAGDTLLVLEAMKMEHTVKAPEDGVVARLVVATGEQVTSDALLVVIAAPA